MYMYLNVYVLACHVNAGELLNLTALGHDDIILKLVAAGPT